MSNFQFQGKNRLIASVLSIILWGSGHYYIGDKALGIILMFVNIMAFITFRLSWVYILFYFICTLFVVYDIFRKTPPSSPLRFFPRVNMKLFIPGLALFFSNFFVTNNIVGIILIFSGVILMVASYAITPKIKGGEK